MNNQSTYELNQLECEYTFECLTKCVQIYSKDIESNTLNTNVNSDTNSEHSTVCHQEYSNYESTQVKLDISKFDLNFSQPIPEYL
jgi:hypothetical protein